MKRSSTPIPFPRQTLALWCREDHHDRAATLIENCPAFLLPEMLRLVARYVEQNMTIRDEYAEALPWILRDEAQARRVRRRSEPIPNLLGAILLSSLTFAVWLFDGLWL